MKNTSLIILFSLTLGACTLAPSVNEVTDEYVDKRRAIHSDLSDAAEAWFSRGISVLEWRARFDTPEKAAAWRILFSQKADAPLPTSEPEVLE
jgi:hypothetical protein